MIPTAISYLLTKPEGPAMETLTGMVIRLAVLVLLPVFFIPPALIGKGLAGIGLGTTKLFQPKLLTLNIATPDQLAIWQEKASIQKKREKPLQARFALIMIGVLAFTKWKSK